MLRGAYSHLNHFSRFLLLIILIFSFLLFSTLFGLIILVPFYGSGVITMLSSPDYNDVSIVNALKTIQIVNMLGGLLLPALIYLWLCTPSESNFIRFGNPNALITIFLAALVVVFAQPLIGWASELNSKLTLPPGLSFLENWMRNAENQGEMITEAFLATTSAPGLLLNVFMIAVLPAFAEEILFRGVLADLFRNWTKSTHLAVILSSLIFAAIHLQFYGFLPRFILGLALGYLFFWSGSLWLPVAAHFANNFLSVVIEFLYRKGYILTNAEEFGTENAPMLITLSLIIVAGVMYYIFSLSKQEQTN